MKIIQIFFFLFLISLHFSASAGTDACYIDPNETRPANEFLSNCGAGTTGIDPSKFSDDMAGTRDQVIKIANGAISFGALLAVGALVWSGIQYSKAFGEDEKLKKAKTTGIYSLIGLVLLLVSFGLVDIFINFVYTITGN